MLTPHLIRVCLYNRGDRWEAQVERDHVVRARSFGDSPALAFGRARSLYVAWRSALRRGPSLPGMS